MIVEYFLLGGMAFSFGVLSAAGVFTVLVAVGLVPRFAGSTHTAGYVLWYEEMVVFGTMFGNLLSVFDKQAASIAEGIIKQGEQTSFLSEIFMTTYGLFGGIFVGCLALAIAEMLDSIPIFFRRISLRHGIGVVVWSVAVGKVAGALFYFLKEL